MRSGSVSQWSTLRMRVILSRLGVLVKVKPLSRSSERIFCSLVGPISILECLIAKNL